MLILPSCSSNMHVKNRATVSHRHKAHHLPCRFCLSCHSDSVCELDKAGLCFVRSWRIVKLSSKARANHDKAGQVDVEMDEVCGQDEV